MSWKVKAKHALLAAEELCGIEWARDKVWAARGILTAPVLVFHRVTDDIPGDGITVSTRRFREIVRNLKDHYNPIPLARLLDYLAKGETWPAKTVVVTFDDGYLDNHAHAAPILAEYGVSATFFVTTDAIGSDRVMPWDAQLPRRLPWMDWHHVRELRTRGFEIGSHTLTHPDLGKLPPSDACVEIAGSKEKLEQELGSAVTSFAYPFGGKGNITEENRELVKRAGYSCCCSAYGGFVRLATDRFNIHRLGVNSWYSDTREIDFEIRIAAPWRWGKIAADGSDAAS